MTIALLRPRRATVVTSAAAAALLLAACGGGGGSSEVASLGTLTSAAATETTASPADTQEATLAFAACMRENGVDMADPTFDASGNVTGGGFGPGSGIDPGSDEFRAAIEVCGSLIEGVGFGGGPGGRLDGDAIQTALTDFTACLRDEGLEVDDITFGPPGDAGGPDGSVPDGSVPPGGFGGGPPGVPPGDGDGPGGDGFDPTARLIEQLGLDADDPAVTAALDACQSIIDGAFTPPTEG